MNCSSFSHSNVFAALILHDLNPFIHEKEEHDPSSCALIFLCHTRWVWNISDLEFLISLGVYYSGILCSFLGAVYSLLLVLSLHARICQLRFSVSVAKVGALTVVPSALGL